MPITRLGLSVSTHQVSCSLSTSLLPRVHACFHLLCKANWRQRCRENLSYIPLKTTTQPVECLPCKKRLWAQIQLVARFFLWFIPFVSTFLHPKFLCKHLKHISMQDFRKIARYSSGNFQQIDMWFRLFLTACWRYWCKEDPLKVELHSC